MASGPLDIFRFNRSLCLAAIGIAAVAGLLVFGLVNASRVRAQSSQVAEAPLPSFEVASVKPNHSGTSRRFFSFGDPGRFTATNVTAKMIIEFAYNVKDFQLSGGPSWINSEGYDINAKVDDSLAEQLQKLPLEQRLDQNRLMLQPLIADRFKLKLTRETKELPVNALVVAKGGPKLTSTAFTPPDPSSSNPATPPNGPGIGFNGIGKLVATDMPVSALADVLPMQADLGGRMILDQTGLAGKYDFTLQWTPVNPVMTIGGVTLPPLPGAAAPVPDGPSIFTAIQEQLGLKLESTKGPVDTIVIDHVEEPSEN
jgi:uncharacterized protein (TIGR03435 family)